MRYECVQTGILIACLTLFLGTYGAELKPEGEKVRARKVFWSIWCPMFPCGLCEEGHTRPDRKRLLLWRSEYKLLEKEIKEGVDPSTNDLNTKR